MEINWEKADNTARSLLKHYNINSFPFNIYSFLTNYMNIKVLPYSELINVSSCPNKVEVKKRIYNISKDSFASFSNDASCIFYNDDYRNESIQRIRYSLAHELGHILLGHFNKYKLILVKSHKYNYLEKEADAFASEFLSPIELIDPSWSAIHISRLFDISPTSASVLLKRLSEFSDDTWIHNSNGFNINNINFNKYNQIKLDEDSFFEQGLSHYIVCHKCHFMGEFKGPVKFCPICGSTSIKILSTNNFFPWYEKEKEDYVKYYGIETSNGLAFNCPKCKKMNIEGKYFCDKCGTYLLNRCSGIKDIDTFNTLKQVLGNNKRLYSGLKSCNNYYLDGMYRYCPYCGCLSTFSVQNLFNVNLKIL